MKYICPQVARRLSEVILCLAASGIGSVALADGDVVQALHTDPGARVVVLGGFNDFEFSSTSQILKSAGLVNLVDQLPRGERYNQIFDGNSLTGTLQLYNE